jgi:hypothetical protein
MCKGICQQQVSQSAEESKLIVCIGRNTLTLNPKEEVVAKEEALFIKTVEKRRSAYPVFQFVPIRPD